MPAKRLDGRKRSVFPEDLQKRAEVLLGCMEQDDGMPKPTLAATLALALSRGLDALEARWKVPPPKSRAAKTPKKR